MVANGEKMHAILIVTQEDAQTSRDIAEQSRVLAEEMKQDSVAMKTVCDLNTPPISKLTRVKIAVTTMFFLPGTSFAVRTSSP